MICKKCDGEGVVTKLTQLSGSDEDVPMGVMMGLLTCGLSLLVTTRLKEVTCPRCRGTGYVGYNGGAR